MSFSKIDPDSFHTRRVSSTHVAIRFLTKVAEKWWLSIIVYGTRAAKADTLHYSSPAEFDTEKKPITFPPLVSGQEIHYSRAWTWTHDVDADLAHPYHQCPMWMHPIRIPRFRPFRIQPLAKLAPFTAITYQTNESGQPNPWNKSWTTKSWYENWVCRLLAWMQTSGSSACACKPCTSDPERGA